MDNKLKIVFLGSGEIAVPILRALAADAGVEISAVISQPDRPAGRKRIMTPTPLAAAALALGIEPLRSADVNSPEMIDFLTGVAPDILCVVSFGQILKSAVLAVPECCCVNVHASLLPAYRGASPIVQAICNRDTETGVCFMEMERGLDTGAVFRKLTLPLDGSEYADALEIKLGELAAAHAAETLRDIAGNKLVKVPQDPAKVSVCRKISKRDGAVDWNYPASRIEAMSRAYFPWPGAVTWYQNGSGKSGVMTICSCRVVDDFVLAPGECAALPGRIVAGCGENSALEILELIPAGGRRMSAAAFRNGMRGQVPVFITEEPC